MKRARPLAAKLGRPKLPDAWTPARIVAEFRKYGAIGSYVVERAPAPRKRGELESAISAACEKFEKDRSVVRDHWVRFTEAKKHSLGIDPEKLLRYDDLLERSIDGPQRAKLYNEIMEPVWKNASTPTTGNTFGSMDDGEDGTFLTSTFYKLTDQWSRWLLETHLLVKKKRPRRRANRGK